MKQQSVKRHTVRIFMISILSLALIVTSLPIAARIMEGSPGSVAAKWLEGDLYSNAATKANVVQNYYVSAASRPKIKLHYYKGDKNIKYYSIKGSKYKAANKAMKKQAAKAYKEKQKTKNGDIYTFKLIYSKPVVKFNNGKKISIYVHVYYEKENNGNWGDKYYGFNFYKGKRVTLKGAFKNTNYYNKANQEAVNYYSNLPSPLDDDYNNGIAGKAFYWTKSGIKIRYLGGGKAAPPFIDAPPYYSVKKSYLKYF
jgi:hypothetical protein